jgi:hypothetical protein
MKADEIILMKMADIVFVDKRSFCFIDFLSFEYNGKEYKFDHGTIRNIFSKLNKNGDIEYEYRSGPTFYTLRGHKFGKPMTVNHTERVVMMAIFLQNKGPSSNAFVRYRWIKLQFMISV